MKKLNLNPAILIMVLVVTFSSNSLFAQKNNQSDKREKVEKRTTTTKVKATKKTKAQTPVKHYSKQPRRGAQVTSLPRKTVVVKHRNTNYQYRDGIFYRPVNGSYVVAAPPRGIHVTNLPPKPFRILVSGSPYYYYYGTYYIDAPQGGYTVVDAPLGARIDALPDGYEVFELDGMVFYRLDETYYKAVVEPNGNVVYEVVRV